jgi:hypothetical protein
VGLVIPPLLWLLSSKVAAPKLLSGRCLQLLIEFHPQSLTPTHFTASCELIPPAHLKKLNPTPSYRYILAQVAVSSRIYAPLDLRTSMTSCVRIETDLASTTGPAGDSGCGSRLPHLLSVTNACGSFSVVAGEGRRDPFSSGALGRPCGLLAFGLLLG